MSQERPWHATLREYGIPLEIDTAPQASVTELLEDSMRRFAALPALRSCGQTMSYAELDRLSAAFGAWAQQALGVKKGDRVAVMLPNLLAFPIVFVGLARIGAVQVNVNPLYTPRELAHQLKDSGSEIIVIYTGSTPVLAEVLAEVPIKAVVTAAPGDGTPAALPAPPVDARIKESIRLADALEAGAKLALAPVASGPEDLLFLQYTGGTTGFSKGAALTHGNLVANIAQFKAGSAAATRVGQEVVVTAIPLYHIFALMVNFLTYFSVGADNWLVANPRDMDGLVDTLAQARPTVFMGVNTLYAGLTLHPRLAALDWSRLRLAGGGGAAVMATVSARWHAATGKVICEGYGLSETSPVLSFNPPGLTEFAGTCGLPLPNTDIVLLDDADQVVAPGERGEVCAKGPQVMRGYWRQPEANAAAFTPDGYFRTGDIGVFDARGFLRIVDRKKDMILVSGFNVYPNEIEAVGAACPGVAECACIGVPDDKTGEAVKLFVVRRPGAELDEATVLAHCRHELAAYKVPRFVAFLDALPKSTVGKILRRELRDLSGARPPEATESPHGGQ